MMCALCTLGLLYAGPQHPPIPRFLFEAAALKRAVPFPGG